MILTYVHRVPVKGRDQTHVSNSVKLKKIHWQILEEICNKAFVKDTSSPCLCCHTTLWKYLVPEIAMFTKTVKQSCKKDSNCRVRFNHWNIVDEKVLSGDVSIIQLTDKNIFSVRTAQLTEWSIIRICIINLTGNCFCSGSSICNPLSCLQYAAKCSPI